MEQEGSNSHDYFATVVKKDGNVVGRVPTELPKIYWNFLARGGRINCEVTGRRKRGKGSLYLQIWRKHEADLKASDNQGSTVPAFSLESPVFVITLQQLWLHSL